MLIDKETKQIFLLFLSMEKKSCIHIIPATFMPHQYIQYWPLSELSDEVSVLERAI